MRNTCIVKNKYLFTYFRITKANAENMIVLIRIILFAGLPSLICLEQFVSKKIQGVET